MRYSRKEMKIRVDYNNMMAATIGRSRGITETDIERVAEKADRAYNAVAAKSGIGMMGWTKLATGQEEVVEDIIATAKQVRRSCEYFVVLGIGGSALGPIAAFRAIKHLHYNDLKKSKRRGPKFYVEDNVDPERMQALLDVIEPEKTIFNVTTKSGSTSETMTQYLIINDILKKALGDKASEHIITTTSAAKGNLIKLAKKEGYKTFHIPDGVGGRFSELCPVGLLPAAVLGIDIRGLLAGAKFMQELCENTNIKRNPALMSAVLQYIAMDKYGKNISVMMPYADRILAALKERGLKLACFTNKQQKGADEILGKLGLDKYLDAVIATSLHSARKPDREFTEYALKTLSLEAAETVGIGDSPYDYKAARVCNVASALVATGGDPAADLREKCPEALGVYADFKELALGVFDIAL